MAPPAGCGRGLGRLCDGVLGVVTPVVLIVGAGLGDCDAGGFLVDDGAVSLPQNRGDMRYEE